MRIRAFHQKSKHRHETFINPTKIHENKTPSMFFHPASIGDGPRPPRNLQNHEKSKFIKFFLPDTFSPDSDAFPEQLEEFQRFNLAICKDNTAVANPIKTILYLEFLNLLAKNLISLKSCFNL